MRAYILAFIFLVGAAAAPAQVKVTGAEGGSLSALIGSPTLVTVVLKESEARDANLRVLEKTDSAINFMNAANEVIPYLISDISEIEVQGGKIEKSEFTLDQSRALRPEEQIIYDRALARSREIYNESASNQEIKIRAATLLALNTEEDALAYLLELAQSNNINAQLSAALGLYLAQQAPAENTFKISDLIESGLESGNRTARAQAAELAGLTGQTSAVPDLLTLLQDRASNQAGPAAVALARLGARESIPQLLGMLESRNDEKGESARWALVTLGGPDVAEQMRILLPKAQGFGKFRVAQVLYGLNDEEGKREMDRIFREVYSLSQQAAQILASNGDFDAMGDLQNRLNQRMQESDEGMIAYVEIAKALLIGGDTTAQSVMQQILLKDRVEPAIAVCKALVEVGNRRTMPLIQASIESRELPLAIESCTTSVALGNPEFRIRLLASRVE